MYIPIHIHILYMTYRNEKRIEIYFCRVYLSTIILYFYTLKRKQYKRILLLNETSLTFFKNYDVLNQQSVGVWIEIIILLLIYKNVHKKEKKIEITALYCTAGAHEILQQSSLCQTDGLRIQMRIIIGETMEKNFSGVVKKKIPYKGRWYIKVIFVSDSDEYNIIYGQEYKDSIATSFIADKKKINQKLLFLQCL